MRQWVLIFLGLSFFFTSKSQSLNLISFEAYMNDSPLKLDSIYSLTNGEKLNIKTLKFYISEIEYLQDNVSVEKEEGSFHLVDLEDKKSQYILIKRNNTLAYNKIKFILGIDSITNVSGALGGDLDPTKGMYWAWQSGYINLKLEGVCSLSGDKKKEFEFHLGGYNSPFLSAQQIILDKKHEGRINIVLHIDQFFKQIDLTKQHHIMSPGKEAADLSRKFSSLFSLMSE